jgi:hypothetical protein
MPVDIVRRNMKLCPNRLVGEGKETAMLNDASDLLARTGQMIQRAGIDNFSFDREMLVMCGVRYVIEQCTCGADDCYGVRLRRAIIAEGGSGLQ